jgi:hypothetical protein
MTRWHHVRPAATAGILAAWLVLGPALPSAAQPPGDFEHLTTRFPLTGAHVRVPCEDCHLQGVFSGTPIQCGLCHTRGGPWQADGKPLDHVPSSDQCDDCHVTNSWTPARFDHGNVTSPCATCHNGGFATGKPIHHVPSSDDCEACHGTIAWSPAFFDHAGITTGCVSCHNGQIATGKNPGHIPSSDACETCHNTRRWEGAGFDHTGITTGCVSCHNGQVATGKPNGHPPSSDACETCHDTRTWQTAGFDHTGITTGCVSCHDGRTAIGKNPGHIPSSDACETCHDTRSFAGARFDHSTVTGNCASCHDGQTATGTPSGHFIVTGIDCVECHLTTAWLPTTFRHTSPNYPGDHAGNPPCQSCHTGNSPVVAWPFPAYAPDCAGCHANDFRPDPHLKIQSPQTRYTVGELRDCTGACHTYSDATLTTITRSRTGQHRVNRSSW